jgi:putative membrane protein
VIALKHKLRFEPYATYDDLYPLIGHLDTFALSAGEPDPPKKAHVRKVGYWMGFPMARSNPRKLIKRAKHPVGNLPLEILSHISAYLTEQIDMGTLGLGIVQNQTMNVMNDLNHILATTERVQTTPLPLAYSITISQITWVYLLTLPFQLTTLTGWLCIPITITTAYIVLGILYIGNELENPFGTEVNNLPLENYCEQIVTDVNVIAAISPAVMKAQIHASGAQLLYPLSLETREVWSSRSEVEIRAALNRRADPTKSNMWERLNTWRMQAGVDEEEGSAQSDTVCGDCEQGRCGGGEGHPSGDSEVHRSSWRRGSRLWNRSSLSKGLPYV